MASEDTPRRGHTHAHMLNIVESPPEQTSTPVKRPSNAEPKMLIQDVNFFYGNVQALWAINLAIPTRQITALIGPSGCGKSTLLRCLNRLNDLIEEARLEGAILLDNLNIHDPQLDITDLRKRVGMVFQRSNPFPKSIYENVVYGPRLQGIKNRAELDVIAEKSLTEAGLWDEVNDRLAKSALGLSGGQQQRLCIARALAVEPDVLLMDEPCSSLDPIATGKIEELLFSLKNTLTIIIVTHNMQQAARISDHTGFLLMGELVEFGETKTIFTVPTDPRTEDYITGRFG